MKSPSHAPVLPKNGEPEPLTEDDLCRWFEEGSKPFSRHAIGAEYEKFLFDKQTLKPLPFLGERGVEGVVENIRARSVEGSVGITEGEHLLGIKFPNGASLTLEPAGQLELSGALLPNLHDVCAEIYAHVSSVAQAADEVGAGILSVGFAPTWSLDDAPRLPKSRYDIMRQIMPHVGNKGLEMMHLTCTIQVNLDYAGERDMARKMRAAMALQPVVTALFANSPFRHGAPNGYKSYRAACWLDVDPSRTGILPFVFDKNFGFGDYARYLIRHVPMYFIARSVPGARPGSARIHHANLGSFAAFMEGKLPDFEGWLPTIADWKNHVGFAFPEVRLKQFLEMRGADATALCHVCALPALWVGLLYDPQALNDTETLTQDWTAHDVEQLRQQVPQMGGQSIIRGRTVAQVAKDVLAIARRGLRMRNRLDSLGENEEHYLNDLNVLVDEERCPADVLLDRYHGQWHNRIEEIFKEEQGNHDV